jgi:threonine dehydratase
MENEPAVTIKDVRAAARRIDGIAVRTPLLRHPALDTLANGPVLLKLENLQREGSFKFRGAYNRLAQLTEAERAAGVVAWSSGNHAQGVAAAARLLGIRAVIVMPTDAPAVKTANTRALGAEIVLYDRVRESREEIARELARQLGAVLVPSYDDAHVVAGQGTVGLEIADQAHAAGLALDRALVCCGGGGLIAGTAIALADAFPGIRVWSVEPNGYDDTARSLAAGRPLANVAGTVSICDALLAPEPGAVTFPLNRTLLAGGLAVSDGEVRAAVRFAFERLRLVVEPGGAVALAALLAGRVPLGSGAIAVVISGGNIDPVLLAEIVA